jgi:hypothetical protein
MSPLARFLLNLLRRIPRLILSVAIGWLRGLVVIVHMIAKRCRYRLDVHCRKRPPPCLVIPPHTYKRADPLIYSQSYLLAQGLAVTWDNPDIQLYQAGVPVSSSELVADTDYEVVARIWNGSMEAPAVNLPVAFSFLDAGIGTPPVALGTTHVDLPIRGAPGHPVFAQMPWHTPATPGHYCLRVDLQWPDDANPNNNLGQENTLVGKLNSPHAQFQFPVRNDALRPRTLRLEADAYRLSAAPFCNGKPSEAGPKLSAAERAACLAEARRRAGRGAFPIPAGWQVTIAPRVLPLTAGETRLVTVDIVAPDGFHGRQTLNVSALDGEKLAGGVTLTVESA